MCFFAVFPAFLSAQTAAEFEALLAADSISYAEAAGLILRAADVDVAGPGEAFSYAAEQNWLPANAAPDDRASLSGISLLIVESFGMKGGLFYSLTKSPHYAYRELEYRNVIQGRADPSMNVSGDQLFFVVGQVLSLTESQAESARLALLQQIDSDLRARGVPASDLRITDEGVTITLSNVQFGANSTALTETTELMGIVEALKAIPNNKLMVSGHTAMAGTEEGRIQTSTERAQSLADFLISRGVRSREDITVRGFGAERPLADNDTPEGMTRNRRVEITILDGQV